MLPLGLFRDRTFSAASAIGLHPALRISVAALLAVAGLALSPSRA